MAFYDELTALGEVTAFLSYVGDKFGRPGKMQVNAWFYIMKVHGADKFQLGPTDGFGINATKQAGIPMNGDHAKIEMIIGYALVDGMTLRGQDAPIRAMFEAQKGHQRNYADWDRLLQMAPQNRWDIGKMWEALVESAELLEPKIERYYGRYMQDNAAVLAFGSADGNVQALAVIRDHQKDKAVGGKKGIFNKGGHTSGNFILYDTAGDGKPLILISSKEKKAIKSKHVKSAVKVTLPNAKCYSGTYENKGGSWSFVVTTGSASGVAQMTYNAANRGSKGVDPWSNLFSKAMQEIGVSCLPNIKLAL